MLLDAAINFNLYRSDRWRTVKISNGTIYFGHNQRLINK